jgi:hypothetical protein
MFHSAPLKHYPGFPGAVGHSFNHAVVQITVPVKHNGLDVSLKKPFSYYFAQPRRALDIRLKAPQILFQGGSGSQSMSLAIVNNLNVQGPIAPDYAHPGALGGAHNTLADMHLPFIPFSVFFEHFSQHRQFLSLMLTRQNHVRPFPGPGKTT